MSARLPREQREAEVVSSLSSPRSLRPFGYDGSFDIDLKMSVDQGYGNQENSLPGFTFLSMLHPGIGTI